ncbi:ribulose-phosphate 3-epimerase [Candidatus Cloacimonadaceae bacterium]
MQKTLIAPSLLSADLGRLADEIAALESAGADILHLDVMDGHYVPNLSFGFPLVSAVRKLTKLPLDVHLMVTNPELHVPVLGEIGVQMISFHQEAVFHSHRLIQQIKQNGVKAGLALNPATPVSSLESILGELDFVLVMSVNPGYSAQAFIPSSLEKIARLNGLKPGFQIEVDGGVADTNSARLIEAGADILVSASYIFGSKSYSNAIKALRQNTIL